MAEQPIAQEAVPTEPAKEKLQPEIIKIEAPEVEAPKIVDKIDLSAIDSSTRPKKDAKKTTAKSKKETATKEVTTKPKADNAAEEVVVPNVEPTTGPVKTEPATITNIKADKLEGPKILGKIELPINNDTRPKPSDEKRKRKRIVVE